MKATVRSLTAHFLADVLRGETTLAALAPAKLSPLDRALQQELCFGVCRFYYRLDAVLRTLLPKPLKDKDADVKALLLVGLYQLFYTRVPDHAAIGATVEAAVGLKKPWAKGLVNGVLRNAQRQQESLQTLLESTLNHPAWFAKELQKAWPEHWQAILEANDQRPPLTLRINRLQTTREETIDQLQLANIDVDSCQFASDGITLHKPQAVLDLPGFALGELSVQDEAAQLAADLLDLHPGQRVLDACCAPGGKTGHMLERESNLAEVVAIDLEESRMSRVRDNLSRLGLQATLRVADAMDTATWWDGKPFDRILLDAPCSATGVIRRHPDIKILRQSNDVAKLVEQQERLLEALWPTLQPGGLLVYATCSVLPRENEQVVDAFLQCHPDAEAVALDVAWGHERKVGRQLFPQEGGHDGFYYAVLRKSVSV